MAHDGSSQLTVLFVDDEPMVLAGIRRMLRHERDRWRMVFVEGGRAAIQQLDDERVDVIVCDLRMPDIDGIAVLEAAQRRHPDAARIILSGYADRANTMKATGVAHQFLAKPCEADTVVATIERSTALRCRLTNPRILAAVGELTALPPMPDLYHRVADELAKPDSSLARVGDLMARDPGMSAKILQIVNSSFFGLRRRVADVRQAVVMLGVDTVVALVLGSRAFDSDVRDAKHSAFLQQLWSEALSVAGYARGIARSLGIEPAVVEEAYLTALLHDCGRAVLGPAEPSTDPLEAERRIHGADHQDAGAYLMALWGLPDTVVEGVAFHHRPSNAPVEGIGVLTAVHAAQALAQDMDHPRWIATT